MCEITVNNFKQKFPEIKKNLETCKFIGIDLEFSALNPISTCAPSLFDNPRQRYAKLKKNVEFTIPLQIGLTAFQFDAYKNKYHANTYTFYIKPGLFSHIDSYFVFQSSSLEFLSLYNFDFNKFVYLGIPYISKANDQSLRKKFANDEITETNMNFSMEIRLILETQSKVVNEWYKKAKSEDVLTFPELSKRFKNNIEFKYFFHKQLRRSFKYVWTYENDDVITLKKVSEEAYAILEKNISLEEELFENLAGFRKVYCLLTSLQKPLIAHNALMDILIMMNTFEGSLPPTYDGFKKLLSELFPIIFDTKNVCYNLRKIIPEEKQFGNTDLKSLFEYFKNGTGRHLTMHSPAIDVETENDDYFDKYHEAGWDSFCAGYIFIRMAFLKIHQDHPKSKIFMPVELLHGLKQYKNCLNVIRGSINHINIGGEDPESIRPPWLVVESVRGRKLDLKELSSCLSAYGNIEVKPITWRSNKAVVAVENYASAKSLMRGMKDSPNFRIQQYNYIKHSPISQVAIWGGLAISGVALVWLMRDGISKSLFSQN